MNVNPDFVYVWSIYILYFKIDYMLTKQNLSLYLKLAHENWTLYFLNSDTIFYFNVIDEVYDKMQKNVRKWSIIKVCIPYCLYFHTSCKMISVIKTCFGLWVPYAWAKTRPNKEPSCEPPIYGRTSSMSLHTNLFKFMF